MLVNDALSRYGLEYDRKKQLNDRDLKCRRVSLRRTILSSEFPMQTRYVGK